MGLMDGWSAAAQAQLAGGVIRAAVLLRIAATSGVIRLWGGDGDFDYPAADRVEGVAGATYTGLGVLLASLPQVSQLLNGESDRVEFTLSGAMVTPEVAELAAVSASNIRSVPANLGFLVLDANFQPLSPTAWLWPGVCDSLRVARTASGRDQPTRKITLSCAALFSGRRIPELVYWTDRDQRQRSSSDRFCERVAIYNEGTTMVWPPA